MFNITMREARQRCAVNGCSLRRDYTGEYRVAPTDAGMSNKRREEIAYYTDDLEEAVLAAGAIRAALNKHITG